MLNDGKDVFQGAFNGKGHVRKPFGKSLQKATPHKPLYFSVMLLKCILSLQRALWEQSHKYNCITPKSILIKE